MRKKSIILGPLPGNYAVLILLNAELKKIKFVFLFSGVYTRIEISRSSLLILYLMFNLKRPIVSSSSYVVPYIHYFMLNLLALGKHHR